MALHADAERLWHRYLASRGPRESSPAPFVTAGPAGSPQLTDELLRLYLAGRKTAGSSLLEDFLATGDRVPRVGDHWILLAGTGEPRCILRTERLETHTFKDVPDSVAIAEGEGDLSVGHWKHVHAELYAPHLEQWGLSELDQATVVTEFFQIVFSSTD